MKTLITCLIALLLSGCGIATAGEIPEVVLQTIAMESASEPEGMHLVAKVIQNRAKMTKTSVYEVVLSPKQFSCWNSPKWAKAWLSKHYTPKTRLRALNAYKQAMLETRYNRITHYCTIETMPYWSKGHIPSVIIGGHKFYEGID